MDEVNGRIEAVLYASEDSGYAVLRVATEDGGEVSVVGCIPLASPERVAVSITINNSARVTL